jgi:hypothetical protein
MGREAQGIEIRLAISVRLEVAKPGIFAAVTVV